MKVSFFNYRMDIWYVLKKQGFNHCNYHPKQITTVKSPACRVLKKLTRQAWNFNMSLYHYTVFFIHGKFLFSFADFQKV